MRYFKNKDHHEESGEQEILPAPDNEEDEEKQEAAKPQLVLASTQMLSPVVGIKDGIIITKDSDYVQILEINPVNFLLFTEQVQEAIADTFGAAIAAFPNRFQIKILSRQANVDEHIRDLETARDMEPNEMCKKMQTQSIDKIRTYAENSISKKFYIAHAYESKGLLHRPSWQEICSELTSTSIQIASQLGKDPCLNTLAAPIGSTDAQLDALYQCMCREEAKHKSFQERVTEVVGRYAAAGKLAGDATYIHENEFLAPKEVNPFNSHYLVVDGKYMAYGYIDGGSYATVYPAGWVQQLVDLGEDIDIDIFVEKIDPERASQSLSTSIKMSESSLMHRNDSSADLDKLNDKLQSSLYIRSGISRRQTLLNFSIMLTVVADDPSALSRRMKEIKARLAPGGLVFVPLHYRHLNAFLASLPLCTDSLGFMKKAKRNVLSCDFGAAYPFVSFEVNDKSGLMLGVNRFNGSPVFLNPYDRDIYSSGSALILGPPGTGKTYCMQTLALGLRELGVQIIIIAPYKGYEYRAACEAIGGQFITLAPGSPHNINVMEIRQYDSTIKDALAGGKKNQVSRLTQKINWLHAFMSMLKRDMTDFEKQDFDEAAREVYKDFGITEGNKSLFDPNNPGKYKPMPTLKNLYDKLRSKSHSDGLCAVLKRFVEGSARSFAGQTNVDLNNPYVVIDISEMPKELVPLGMFIANEFAVDTIRADNTQRTALFNDEISRMIGIMGSDESAEIILENCKLVRGYNGIVINATQDTNDFFALRNGVYGKGLIANSKIAILFRQEHQEAKTVQEIFNLSETEATRIQYYEPGEGLLIANRNHVEIKVLASPLEDDLINSDPAHIKRRLQSKGLI